jgi:hypothetical protein
MSKYPELPSYLEVDLPVEHVRRAEIIDVLNRPCIAGADGDLSNAIVNTEAV